MSAGPEVLTTPGKERVSAEVPGDVARRLRVWAGLRGQPAAHVVAQVICDAVPSADQLAKDIRGERNGRADA